MRERWKKQFPEMRRMANESRDGIKDGGRCVEVELERSFARPLDSKMKPTYVFPDVDCLPEGRGSYRDFTPMAADEHEGNPLSRIPRRWPCPVVSARCHLQ